MRRIKTVLVVGGSGFLGNHLVKRLRDDYRVVSTYRKHYTKIPGVTFLPMDALEREWVKRVAYTVEPNVIIYCAGNNDVEWAEKNGRATDNIHAGGAVITNTVSDIFKPKFIYVSNNYVFDGKRGNYKEGDIVLPITELGKGKLSAENFIRGKSLNYVGVRSAPLVGRGNGNTFSFIDKLRIKLDRGERIDMPITELHSFAPVTGLVDLLQLLVDGGPKNSFVHYGGLTKITYFEFAKLFAKRFGYDDRNIFPIHIQQGSTLIDKPIYDYSLNCSSGVKTLKMKPKLLEETFDWLEEELIA